MVHGDIVHEHALAVSWNLEDVSALDVDHGCELAILPEAIVLPLPHLDLLQVLHHFLALAIPVEAIADLARYSFSSGRIQFLSQDPFNLVLRLPELATSEHIRYLCLLPVTVLKDLFLEDDVLAPAVDDVAGLLWMAIWNSIVDQRVIRYNDIHLISD